MCQNVFLKTKKMIMNRYYLHGTIFMNKKYIKMIYQTTKSTKHGSNID